VIHILVSEKKEFKTHFQSTVNSFEASLNGKKVSGRWHSSNPYQIELLINQKNYRADVVKMSREEKTTVVKINGRRYSVKIEDQFDILLHQLGLDNSAAKKISDIKAPMPGMVLHILVKEGDNVAKGDSVLVLEAMKMENIIKSPGEGIIKRVNAQKGKAVEKGQILIQF